MPEITIVNTSPLFYLHRLGLMEVLNELYGHIIVPAAVEMELKQGQTQGEDVPKLENYTFPIHSALYPKLHAPCSLLSIKPVQKKLRRHS